MSNYEALKHGLAMLRAQVAVLAGDSVGPSHLSWQEVARDCSSTLRRLADLLDEARDGTPGGFVVFPSFEDCEPPAAESQR